MAEINYRDLKSYLTDLKGDPVKHPLSSVYLIHGEELLYKTALDKLLNILIPVPQRNLHYDPIDGSQENIPDIIERVNTFSLLSNLKIVALIDSRIFYTQKDSRILIEKVKERYDAGDIKNAAEHLLDLLGLLNLSYEDVSPDKPGKSLKINLNGLGDTIWLNEVINYCKDKRFPIAESRDHTDLLQRAIERGFPKGNCLIITTDRIDKRRSLFQTIRKMGTVVDCSVPRGERRVDRRVREALLNEQMNMILSKSSKSIDRLAHSALIEMTGFDLRTFSNNVEKLISYVGERSEINLEDVESVLRRTKKDPVFELTNSVTDKNTAMSLFFLDSLLRDNIHPLQVLTAIGNQVRRLLIAKDFVQSSHGETWQPGLSFERFKNNVMPAIQNYDKAILELLNGWKANSDSKVKKKSEIDRTVKTNLLLAKNPGNPYPIFLILQNTENFTKNELAAAFEALHHADGQLKSTNQNPRLVLEKVILAICRQKQA
jgi:DNA polymerase-3 subunit delta